MIVMEDHKRKNRKFCLVSQQASLVLEQPKRRAAVRKTVLMKVLMILLQRNNRIRSLQEIVPLNARNVFGSEDGRPVPRWENIIRETLNKIQPTKPKYQCYSDPPSPSRFNPADDALLIINELLPESDSEDDDKVHPLDEHSVSMNMDNDGHAVSLGDSKCSLGSSYTSHADSSIPQEHDQEMKPKMKSLNKCHGFSVINYEADLDTSVVQQKKLTKTLSNSERISKMWPEKPLDLSVNRVIDRLNSFKSVNSRRNSSSFKPMQGKCKDSSEIYLIPDLNLEALVGKKRSPFLRIISKQMVGVLLTVWVRRSLRKHIQNLKIFTFGVGAMGYIGNKHYMRPLSEYFSWNHPTSWGNTGPLTHTGLSVLNALTSTATALPAELPVNKPPQQGIISSHTMLNLTTT